MDSRNIIPAVQDNLTARTAALLREEITGGKFSLGDVLPPEQAIAERLGVSRTVLREAVSRLKVEGLVQSKQGRGLEIVNNRRSATLRLMQASEHDIDEILAIVELRLGFESEAAGLAAERRSEQDLADMAAALDTMRTAFAQNDVQTAVEADFRFHEAIAKATRNPNYVTFFSFFVDLYRRNVDVLRQRSAKPSCRRDSQIEHQAVFEAIRSGDAQLARDTARLHVMETAKRMRDADRLLMRDDAPVLKGTTPRKARAA